MKYIDTFREGMHIVDVHPCKSKRIALTRSGKEYDNLVLQNKTGTIDVKIWGLGSLGVGEFETMDYVHVEADTTLFQNSNRMNVRHTRKAQKGEYAEADCLSISKKNIQKVYEELLGYVRSVKSQHLQKLLSTYFMGSPAFAKAFQFHSAAKSVHHGLMGGLLEHTPNTTKLCDYYVSYYPQLNRDLLLTAAIFHGIGKAKELSRLPENDYTGGGQLLGHIIIGTEMMSRDIRTIPGLPEVLALEFKYCILARHGELEYGSPRRPTLLEALALSFAGNTDAKMEAMIEALNVGNAGSGNKGWLGYNRLLETNARKTSGQERFLQQKNFDNRMSGKD